jgi:predicted O-methyltransferase YrrM
MEEVIKKSENIGGLSSREEKEALWNLAQKHIPEGGLAIEVGTWTGGSAVILGEVCRQKKARLICIDGFSADMHGIGGGVHADPFSSVLVNCQGLPIDYMAGNSTNFLKYLKPEIADFIFVDGDHHFPTVKKDIEGFYDILKPGGCYFMHDYLNPCDVKEVVDNYFFFKDINAVDSSVYVIKT